MRILQIIIIMLLVNKGSCFAQDENDNHAHNNELSVAIGVVPLVAEDEITGGVHLHYIKGLGSVKRFGIGLSLETIFDEHKHYTSSIVLQYRITRGLGISYSPGLLIRKEQADYQYQFASHVEATYEIEMGEFHIGPVAELGIEKNGIHYMGGVHLGIDF